MPTRTEEKEIRQAWRQYRVRARSTLRLALLAWAISLALLAVDSPWGMIFAWPAGFFTLAWMFAAWAERDLRRQIAAFEAGP
jgi:hypothetical protein